VLNVEINSAHFWTDSAIVLSWISSPATSWNTCTANRVARIQETTNVSDWKQVPILGNPGDLITPEITQKELVNVPLWWQGPQWLRQSTFHGLLLGSRYD
jgi:hypothetical protein